MSEEDIGQGQSEETDTASDGSMYEPYLSQFPEAYRSQEN